MRAQRAIVFDDDELFRTLFARIFKSKYIEVRTYPSPDRYFCMQPEVESCPVGVACTNYLLTDYKMPGMTGIEFLVKIKNMGCKIPDCCKAIVSGSWLDEEFNEAKKLSLNVFPKSDSKNQISEWIDKEIN